MKMFTGELHCEVISEKNETHEYDQSDSEELGEEEIDED
jgi:hypothetical protein